MRFGALLPQLLVAASCVVAQTATDLIADIYLFGNSSILLNSDVSNVNSSVQGLPWALQVQVDAVNIYRQVSNATLAAQASANFSEQDSYDVAVALINITGYVKTSLNTTASKFSEFGELSPLVLGSLYQLKSASDVFANATIAKLSSAYQGVAPVVKDELDGYFNDAIEAYGGARKSSSPAM